jgi:hypothetical protein
MRAGTQHGTAFQNWIALARETLDFAIAVARRSVDRTLLQRRSIFHSPPGPLVYVKELPYVFVGDDDLQPLERFWAEALATVLPDLSSPRPRSLR